jgi:site-specific DNA recombinase
MTIQKNNELNKQIRCAIYVRISDPEKEKNLLSTKSQEIYARQFIAECENWVALDHVYCDNGYSGKNLERPAFQALLQDVATGLVDRIVVYRYDRVTRSPQDYYWLQSYLKKNGAAIVSATDHVDDTTPDGEYMLHTKVGLAQYERKLTAARVKAKIKTSRQLGIWTGGNVLPGYKSVDRQLVLDKDLAPLIEFMFKRYLEVQSPVELARDVALKALDLPEDVQKRLGKIDRKRVMDLLTKTIYKGYILHEGELYKGRHEAIVDENLWDQVQELMPKAAPHSSLPRTQIDLNLSGIVRCRECNKVMLANFSVKKHRRYTYYTCLNKKDGLLCKGLDMNIDAELVHWLITEEVRKILKEPELFGDLWQKLSKESSPEEAYKRMQKLEAAWANLTQEDRRNIVQDLVKTVTIWKGGIVVEFAPNGSETSKVVNIYGKFYVRKQRRQVFIHCENPQCEKDPTLLKALVFAMRWKKELANGTYETCAELAENYKFSYDYVRRVIKLAKLSPAIKDAILEGKIPPNWTTRTFTRNGLPILWKDQERMVFGEDAKVLGEIEAYT